MAKETIEIKCKYCGAVEHIPNVSVEILPGWYVSAAEYTSCIQYCKKTECREKYLKELNEMLGVVE